MTTLYDALNWMQNGKIQFLILSIGDKNLSSEFQENISQEIQQFFFFDYRNTLGTPMCLYEIWLKNDIKNIQNEIKALVNNSPKDIDLCFIFDGYLINLTDIFDKEAHKYIYAIKFQNELHTAYSKSLRHSKSWHRKTTAMLNGAVDNR